MALLHYLDAFDTKFAFQLRERNSATLANMKNDAIGVETNLMAKKMKLNAEWKGVKDEPSSSQSTDAKFEVMLKMMEKVVDKLTPPRVEPQPQTRNPNFIRPPGPQILQRYQRNLEDQQAIRPPFPKNLQGSG